MKKDGPVAVDSEGREFKVIRLYPETEADVEKIDIAYRTGELTLGPVTFGDVRSQEKL